MKKAPLKSQSFGRSELLEWIGKDQNKAPFREAILITKVPVRSTTLNRIKAGGYPGSQRLWNAIRAVVENNP